MTPSPPILTRVSRRQIVFWAIFVGMLALDQWVKSWVRESLPVYGTFGGKPLPGIFELTLTYNEGIAFGMFQGAGRLLAPIAIIIAGGAAWYSYKHPEESIWAHVAMGLLTAGALGNLFDRVVHQRVTDMFWFRAINFPVFNVADSCITVATILLVLTWWREALKHKATESSQPETPAT